MLGQARLARGLSQRDVAVSLGVSVGTVSRWERGHLDYRHALAELAFLLGVDERRLVEEAGR